jgi:hypothetical protein
MKTSEIKQIIAKDPNAVFRIGGRGRYTHYGSITEIKENVVDTYSSWGRKTGTRVNVLFTVRYEYFTSGTEAHYGYPEKLPSVTLERNTWTKPRDIEWHVSDFGQTIEEYVVKTDAEVKADWQAKKDNDNAKQQLINRILNDFGIVLSVGDEATDKRWDHLNDELDRLSLDTLKMLVHNYTPSRV